MAYTTNDVKTIFNVAPETVRNWAREFSHYLSATANPEVGRTRLFSDDDLKVLDLVNKMRNENKSYEEIHAVLATGQRGTGSSFSPEEVRALIGGEMEKQLSLEIQMLRRQLANAEERIKDYEQVKEQNIRLSAEKDAEIRRANEYAENLKDSQAKLETLFREIGKSYHEGYLAGLNSKADDEVE